MTTISKFLKKPVSSLFLSVFCGFVTSFIILAITGYSPFEVASSLFNGIFSRPKHIMNVVIKGMPIIFTGISVAFAFKGGLFNMGAEGQFIVGTIASLIAGSIFDLPPFFQVLVVVVFGTLAGTLLGGLTGFLKAKFGTHEVITGIMFNWIALYISNFVVSLKNFHRPNSNSTFPMKDSGFTGLRGNLGFLKDSFFSDILKTEVNVGIIVAIVVAIFVSFILNKTQKGYEICAAGLNAEAAKFAGMNVYKNTIYVMMISGGISGLAAALSITGTSPHSISILAGFENNGFNGLSVALIANNSPIGCIFSGLFFSGLIYGGKSMQSDLKTPSEIINIMMGVIVFFVAVARIFPIIVDRLLKRRQKSNG